MPRGLLLLALPCLLVSAPALARSSRAATTHVGFANSHVEYESADTDLDLDRASLGVGLGYAATRNFRLLVQGAYTAQSEASFVDEKGDGYTFAGGVSATIVRTGRLVLDLTALYGHTSDSFELDLPNGRVDVDVTTNELRLGTVAGLRLTRDVTPFVALGAVLFSDGEVETSSDAGAKGTDEIEREGRMTLSAGVDVMAGRFGFRPEATFIGEKSMMLSVLYRI